MLLCFLLSNIIVSANTFGHEQNYCKHISFQNHFTENNQSITSEKVGFDSENSKCLRPDFLKSKENNISVAIEKEIIFPSQNYLEVELAEQTEFFAFSNNISESDFSNQKSYIKLGGVGCVGKVARVATKGVNLADDAFVYVTPARASVAQSVQLTSIG